MHAQFCPIHSDMKMDVSVHVDDGKATSDDEEELDQLMKNLKIKINALNTFGRVFVSQE